LFVFQADAPGWLLASAVYSRKLDNDIELCEVVVVIDQDSHVTVLRQLPFQKTDYDVPTVTQWFPIDLADADGDGQVDVIIEGESYENHWFEVVSLSSGSPKTIFSGLGYYL
jgi:hypothetical protein